MDALKTARARHLLSINDLSDVDLAYILERGVDFARDRRPSSLPLAGDIVGVFFEKTSTRTRTAFSSGALRLGARVITYGPGDLQTNTGENLADTGQVLAGMLDVLVARTVLTADRLAELAAQPDMAVVNAMNVEEHPTQALTDLTTLLRHFGRIEGLRVLYVGEGNNTASALALALSRFRGVELELRTPPGYGLAEQFHDVVADQSKRYDSSVVERHDMANLPRGFDVVYTSRWQTTGTTKPDADWRTIFAPFQVHSGLWESSPRAVFMHDLPAHRGEEVTADVLDGPASIAFAQATNKLHSAMAVLDWCQAGRGGFGA
ncbi:ornithine carbamoyltransferase [Lentzea sp. NPDC051213]|uniref:ornithine carbamoyltransferase n=1 Tax=Lentzea sp. NPDC051213 TaxID=3364126 RepID=UPI0037BA4400